MNEERSRKIRRKRKSEENKRENGQSVIRIQIKIYTQNDKFFLRIGRSVNERAKCAKREWAFLG